MWRATVEQVLGPEWVVVSIPKLLGTSLVGPMQCSFQASVGEKVIVADLTPQARVRDWWVVGRETAVGQWGNPYPHTHLIAEVSGLQDELNRRPDASVLTGKADVPGPWENLGLLPVFTAYANWTKIQYRFTPYGLQLRGMTRLTGPALPMDTVIATIPGLTLPGELDVELATMGPAPDYSATTFQMAVRPDGVLRTREEWWTGGVYSFAHTIPL